MNQQDQLAEMMRLADTYRTANYEERDHLRNALESHARKMVKRESIAGKYFADGQKVTAEGYIHWLHDELERLKLATLPPMKFYGGSADDGDQHEIKCAHIDGWNECRAAMPHSPSSQPAPAVQPSPSAVAGPVTDAEIEKLAVKHEAFGMGLVDAHGLTTHGFDPDGLGNFARELMELSASRAPVALGAEPKKQNSVWCEDCGWSGDNCAGPQDGDSECPECGSSPVFFRMDEPATPAQAQGDAKDAETVTVPKVLTQEMVDAWEKAGPRDLVPDEYEWNRMTEEEQQRIGAQANWDAMIFAAIRAKGCAA